MCQLGPRFHVYKTKALLRGSVTETTMDIVFAADAHDFTWAQATSFRVSWSFTPASKFFKGAPPVSNIDDNAIATGACLDDPSSSAATKSLYSHMQGFGSDEERGLDFAHSLLWYCGYFESYFARRGSVVPFISCGEHMKCKYGLVLQHHKEDKPVMFVMTAKTVGEGVARVFAASVALFSQYRPKKACLTFLIDSSVLTIPE